MCGWDVKVGGTLKNRNKSAVFNKILHFYLRMLQKNTTFARQMRAERKNNKAKDKTDNLGRRYRWKGSMRE